MTKKLLLIIVLATMAAACSKKAEVAPTAHITGKWQIGLRTMIHYDNNPTPDTVIFKGAAGNYLQFNEDLTGEEDQSAFGFEVKVNFTYQLSGTTLTISFPPYDPTDPTTATISTYTVKTLTQNKLELYSETVSGTDKDTDDMLFSR